MGKVMMNPEDDEGDEFNVYFLGSGNREVRAFQRINVRRNMPIHWWSRYREHLEFLDPNAMDDMMRMYDLLQVLGRKRTVMYLQSCL